MIKNNFVFNLRNRFKVLKDLNYEAETLNTWTSIIVKFLTTVKEILRHKKKEIKEWISEEMCNKIADFGNIK